MAKKTKNIDKVRASKDGHEYHEIWVARMALGLLLPTSDLSGIAVEGLSPFDQKKASSGTVEIADTTYYFGKKPNFKSANKVKISQFKYSIVEAKTEFRNSDARKTIKKFAGAYKDNIKNYGEKETNKKVRFELVTNRPIYPYLTKAIKGIADGIELTGESKKQADQFKSASGLNGKQLKSFAERLTVIGHRDSLAAASSILERTITNWSTTNDARARARLGTIVSMVKKKAGGEGFKDNLIQRVDLLAALSIDHEDDLFPCPASLVDVGPIVKRKQLDQVSDQIIKSPIPVLIHADGGIGKTVFLNTLHTLFSQQHISLFFDCFGGGSYRKPDDARHLAKKGLIQLANTLACQGLCDPILPDGDDTEALILTFRRRLKQSLVALSKVDPDKKIVIFLDAIDNSAIQAENTGQKSFPSLLIQSLSIEPIKGVILVSSSRTHRINKLNLDDVQVNKIKLDPFAIKETKEFLKKRKKDVSEIEIEVAQSRSLGNARILDHLIKSKEGLLEKSEINKEITINDLIEQKVSSALEETLKKGYKKVEIEAFLAGLSILIPPIPVTDYSLAQGIDVSSINSFTSDLFPLLENTKFGLMFRDEPTETFILDKYGSDEKLKEKIASNLLKVQDESVYAAYALPHLLISLNDSQKLFDLAFDLRLPSSITSTVGKRYIRLARLKAAINLAVKTKNYNNLVHLMLELAVVGSGDQRGKDYILSRPDLVITTNDTDANRRLFETRTSWPGARHARLAIAHTIAKDPENANRHVISLNEWIDYSIEHDKDKERHSQEPSFTSLDVAAIPLSLLAQNKVRQTITYFKGWRDWFAYEVLFNVFDIVSHSDPSIQLDQLIDNFTNQLGCIAAALTFLDLSELKKKKLVEKLALACQGHDPVVSKTDFHRADKYKLSGGLLYSSLIAISQGQYDEAETIISLVEPKRPGLWKFREHPVSPEEIIPFLIEVIAKKLKANKRITYLDVIPSELLPFAQKIKGSDFKQKLKELINEVSKKDGEKKYGIKPLSYDEKNTAERFIDTWLDPFLELTQFFSDIASAPKDKIKSNFLAFLKKWSEARVVSNYYSNNQQNRLFQIIGADLAMMLVSINSSLSKKTIEEFLKTLHAQPLVFASRLIGIIGILSQRQELHEIAGKEAVLVRQLIEDENEVGSRASYFGDLARAISPASLDEASTYFKLGLEQMDAIGSGDDSFTNELLFFSASIKGKEKINQQNVHALINICELNLTYYEEEKFPWSNFADAVSRVAGLDGLAKISRWDDGSKIKLSYTLLPYIAASLKRGLIDQKEAIALNRLVSPVEYLYGYNSGSLAEIISEKSNIEPEAVKELINQYEKNSPGLHYSETTEKLKKLSRESLGEGSKTYKDLSVRLNAIKAYKDEQGFGREMTYVKKKNKISFDDLIKESIPVSKDAISSSLATLSSKEDAFNNQHVYLEILRAKIPFNQRNDYLKSIASVSELNLYTKLEELKKCKNIWEESSTSMKSWLRKAALKILKINSDDLLSFGYFSSSKLSELSEICEITMSELALELIGIFSSLKKTIPAATWLGLATIVGERADEAECLSALIHLLQSDATNLAKRMKDCEWNEELFPKGSKEDILAGLIWRTLGAPEAGHRWNAAHSIKLFAKFEKWEVLDKLISLYESNSAGAFEDQDLIFYYLHARLWLLIAIDRLAIDYPDKVAKYSEFLIKVALNDDFPHVLLKHFAASALIHCIDAGALKTNREKLIRNVNKSPFAKVKKKKTIGGYYMGRPKNAPDPDDKFFLDLDFDKYRVTNLGALFGMENYEVKDLLAETVHAIDPKITSMYDAGGRPSRDDVRGIVGEYHTYGQQLGWHGLFIVAGQLLKKKAVVDIPYQEGDPWSYWLQRELLTSENGLWLSDGTDKTPYDVNDGLLEEDKKLTGDKKRILNLMNIDDLSINKSILVEGVWSSPEGVDVSVSSCLVDLSKTKQLVRELTTGDPFTKWLPIYQQHGDGDEYLYNEKDGCHPWLVSPEVEGGIDDYDPLGSIRALSRPKFSKAIQDKYSLVPDSDFKKFWKKKDSQKIVAKAEAWKRNASRNKDEEGGGSRLLCSPQILKEVIQGEEKNLIILINLRKYEKGYGSEKSRFFNTVAVVKIDKALKATYYKGPINKTNNSEF